MGKFTELRFHFIWHDARSLAYRKPAFDGLRPSAASVGVGDYARGLVCFISELCVLVGHRRADSWHISAFGSSAARLHNLGRTVNLRGSALLPNQRGSASSLLGGGDPSGGGGTGSPVR